MQIIVIILNIGSLNVHRRQ